MIWKEPDDSNQIPQISGTENDWMWHLHNDIFYLYHQQTFIDILACVNVGVPSAVSSMLERLCPRLMPLTAGGRSTLDPLSWGVEDVTSGETLFSGGEETVMVTQETVNQEDNQPSLIYLSYWSFYSVKFTYACVGQYISQQRGSRLKLGLWLGLGLSMGEGGGSRWGCGGALDGAVDPVIGALQGLG